MPPPVSVGVLSRRSLPALPAGCEEAMLLRVDVKERKVRRWRRVVLVWEGVWEAVEELPAWVWARVPRGPVREEVRGGGGGEVQVREARGEGGVLEGAADEGI